MATTKKTSKKTTAEKARESIKKATDDALTTSRKRGAKVVLRTIEIQKDVFNSTVDTLSKGQDRAGKGIKDLAKRANWVPAEGRQVIDEWVSLTKKNREDFKTAMNKSYDLITTYFERVESGKTTAPKKAPARKKATRKKKTTRTRKTATKTASATA